MLDGFFVFVVVFFSSHFKMAPPIVRKCENVKFEIGINWHILMMLVRVILLNTLRDLRT
jgi:hypothetical protein